MNTIFILSVAAVAAVLLTMTGVKIMQILQLSSYRMRGVTAWSKATRFDFAVRYFSLAFFTTICMLMYVGCFYRYKAVRFLGLLFFALFAVLFIVLVARQKQKTPLKATPRIIRLGVVTTVLNYGVAVGLLFAGAYLPVRYAFLGLAPLFSPLTVAAAHYILLPFEHLNNRRYIVKARSALAANPSLIKIGITGSYGKTTAKRILAAMLEQKYKVVYGKASYNTPLGVSRTVNDGLGDAEVFVAEMGARRTGDIAELCDLVHPQYGIITAVGGQHLESFGSIDAVARTKFELAEHATEFVVLSGDNDFTRQMYEKVACDKALGGAGEDCDVRYSDVTLGEVTTFTLYMQGEPTEITCKLLGRHIPLLAALCAAMSLRLGVTAEQIRAALESLEPVEHRLQLLCRGDVTVLDDAYNANPDGARNALEVMHGIAGTHIVITPGLVEMGKAEEDANVSLGEAVASQADYACFVGKRAAWLKRGALNGGMDESRIAVFEDLNAAVQYTQSIEGKKVILFENDLPDNL